MKNSCLTLVCFLLLWGNFSDANAVPTLLSEVPAYNWYHGCAPTAAASIIGYWDLNGYSNLFDASGWADISLTANVQDHIFSPGDTMTSIFDFMGTSSSGGTSVSMIDDGFVGYTDYRGYTFDSWTESFSSGQFTWEDFTTEIDMGNPMLFSVDTSSSGGVDHAIPVFGYEDRGLDGLWYASYTTWSEAESIAWRQFLGVGNAWGVGYGTFVNAISAPIPAPSAILLGGIGVSCVHWLRKKRAI